MGIIKLPHRSIKFFEKNYPEIFEQGALAEGKWNEESSKVVKKYVGVKHAIPVSSNGTGMAAMLQLMNYCFKRNHVLIQSNTMYGVQTMVNAAGSEIKGIIDCDTIFLVPTLEMVRTEVEKISSANHGKLIVLLSHIGGIINPWMEEITKYCDERNIMVLEDCAHSYGATLNKKHSGTFGTAGVYSFYSTKAVFAGEGGMIITQNEELGELASKYIMYDRFDRKLPIANNIRQSELQALLMTGVLNEVDDIIDNKRAIAKHYIERCDELNIEYIAQNGENVGNYYKFILSSNSKVIQKKYKSLRQVTSKVYDYSLGRSSDVINSHVCLPIWYGQEQSITEKTIEDLNSTFS